MNFIVVQEIPGLYLGETVVKTGEVEGGARWTVVARGTTYFVPPSHLLPPDAVLPYPVVWGGMIYYPPPPSSVPLPYVALPFVPLPLFVPPPLGPQAAARGELNNLDHQGKTLRVFCTPQMLQADLHRFTMASEDFTLTTGDQSLGEGLAAMKKFHYECEKHKQYLMEDMARLDLGLADVEKPFCHDDMLERLLSFQKILEASGKLQDEEMMFAKEFLVSACYPPVIAKDVLVIVTCKDAGGQGDIVNALKTKKLLIEYGCDNVHLVMAGTARNKAIELNPDEDVWLVDDKPLSTDPKNIRRWPAEKKSTRVLVIHVAAQLNTVLETVIKSACTKGNASNARTVYLPEYGYSSGSTYAKQRTRKFYSMGFGAGEYGIHVLDEFFEKGLKGFNEGNAVERAKILEKMTGAAALEIIPFLLGKLTPAKYAKDHRLYAGYSHGHGVRFLKLVAHMERFLPPVKFVDVVLIGNEKRASPPKAIYTDLKLELAGGGGPDLTKLGISNVHFFTFDPKPNTAPQEYDGAINYYKITDAEPEEEDDDDAAVTLEEFFGAMNPTMPAYLGQGNESSMNRAVFEKMGKWLSTQECRAQFRKLGWLICTHRNFKDLFGRYLCRQSVCGNMALDSYLDDEIRLKGEELFQLEMKILGAEKIDPDALAALVELTRKKFS